MVLSVRALLALIENAGMKNTLDALRYQPLDMAMSQLGRIAFRFGRNRIHAHFIEPALRKGGQFQAEAQFLKKYRPERIIFIYIQHAGHSQHSPHGAARLQGLIIKDAPALIFKHIQFGLLFQRAARSPFAAVARNMPAPV